MNAQDIAKQASDIFVLPDVTTRIKELIDDDATTMEDIAELINYDPGLTSQLLKIANSAVYRFPTEIVTLSKAVQVIGTKSVYDLVIAYSVAKAFKDVDQSIIDLERFWERGVSCALLAKYLADMLRIPQSERMFVAGLLHNVGELVILQILPEQAKRCAEFDLQTPPEKRQLEDLGFTYAEVGSCLLALWGIPESIVNPIRHQHFALMPAHSKDDNILQLSTLLALENIYAEIFADHSQLVDAMYAPLGLDMDDVQLAMDYTNLNAISVIQLFSPKAFAIF